MVLKMVIKQEQYQFIVTYFPNDNALNDIKNFYFEELQKTIEMIENDKIIAIGNLNGRVERNNLGIKIWLGKEREDIRNNNGIRDLCIE